jgi:hypothetical protein
MGYGSKYFRYRDGGEGAVREETASVFLTSVAENHRIWKTVTDAARGSDPGDRQQFMVARGGCRQRRRAWWNPPFCQTRLGQVCRERLATLGLGRADAGIVIFVSKTSAYRIDIDSMRQLRAYVGLWYQAA